MSPNAPGIEFFDCLAAPTPNAGTALCGKVERDKTEKLDSIIDIGVNSNVIIIVIRKENQCYETIYDQPDSKVVVQPKDTLCDYDKIGLIQPVRGKTTTILIQIRIYCCCGMSK